MKARWKSLVGICLLIPLFFLPASASDAPEVDAFYQSFAQHLDAEEERFSVPYAGDIKDLTHKENGLPDLDDLLREMTARQTRAPYAWDLISMNIYSGSVSYNQGEITFKIRYLIDDAKQARVRDYVTETVAKLDLSQEDDYTKLKLIYEYVAGNFIYDQTLSKYSAYEGIETGEMVCQGYAILLYQMLWEADVPSRIVVGMSKNERHAWNLVELEGVWYFLDSTWDATSDLPHGMHWTFFLKNLEDFADHDLNPAYTGGAYFPMDNLAEKSYPLPRLGMASQSGTFDTLIIRVDIPVQLEAILPEGYETDVLWWKDESQDIFLDETGLLRAQNKGKTTVHLEAVQERGLIGKHVPVTAVDLRAASPWAFEEVTDYYLAGYLPAEFCDDFQESLTRNEVAQLCFYLLKQYEGTEKMEFDNHFTDVDPKTHDAYAILYLEHKGILEGTGMDTFSPDMRLNREQTAKILVSLLNYCKPEALPQREVSGTVFADEASISAWARPYIATAQHLSLLQGHADGHFAPKDDLTLEAFILTLGRLLDVA